MAERIEEIILRNLLFNEEYYRKVVPFLKAEYYEIYHEKIIYEEIADFASKYDKVPTKEVLTINLQNRNDLTDESFKDSVQAVSNLSDEWVDYDWLLDATEKWCKDRVYTSHSCNQSRLRTAAIRRFREMRYPPFSKKPWRFRLMNTSDTIT